MNLYINIYITQVNKNLPSKLLVAPEQGIQCSTHGGKMHFHFLGLQVISIPHNIYVLRACVFVWARGGGRERERRKSVCVRERERVQLSLFVHSTFFQIFFSKKRWWRFKKIYAANASPHPPSLSPSLPPSLSPSDVCNTRTHIHTQLLTHSLKHT
jgi:hypothetical protein